LVLSPFFRLDVLASTRLRVVQKKADHLIKVIDVAEAQAERSAGTATAPINV
jgi:hypothetical protein